MKAWSTGDCDHGGDEWSQEIRLTEQAVQAVNKLNPKPKFFVLCGDLIHAMPAREEDANHMDSFSSVCSGGESPSFDHSVGVHGTPWRKEQTEDLQRVLKDLDREIPLVLVSGNHDLGNIPTAETIEEFQHTWGDDYFSFWVGGVLFLVLNSQFWYNASQCPALKHAQDHWLDQQLSIAGQRKCRHAIVFQHIPLFLHSIEEEDDYFNLTKAVRKELADKFIGAGVRAVFSGHYHRNAGGTYQNLDMVVSSAIGCQLGKDTHGLRVVVVTAEKITHRYYSLDELRREGIEEDLMKLMKEE
ncbi:serine/threonine-protein phosphatase CPPED1 isoform X3 [Fukomys damarensis]|nr:serine/threonine-protein phosphatase CPPED1 isoform X3 [Fukomys damarensis]XP_010608316.1 serine/threonine-protein phosphatase CPPED1 isoform X3 [Fukomys damarensis]XP_010608317.1 serine/threonine-protein phosphatase CPPED1 isoform X3 [Fukomys damarensis]